MEPIDVYYDVHVAFFSSFVDEPFGQIGNVCWYADRSVVVLGCSCHGLSWEVIQNPSTCASSTAKRLLMVQPRFLPSIGILVVVGIGSGSAIGHCAEIDESI